VRKGSIYFILYVSAVDGVCRVCFVGNTRRKNAGIHCIIVPLIE